MWSKPAHPKRHFHLPAPRLGAGFSAFAVSRKHDEDRRFAVCLLVAASLHIAVAVVWYLLPREPVVDIPVRPLNIKLGDAEIAMTAEEIRAAAPPALEAVVTPEAPKPVEAKSDSPRQFVRAAVPTSVPAVGTEGRAVASARYEQLVSLWIQKFKLYPKEALAAGIQGETVVRVRIDRRGNVRYFLLERSTGHESLDRAAIDMIRRANPVPAVPNDYPAGEEFEFLIPVQFRLQ